MWLHRARCPPLPPSAQPGMAVSRPASRFPDSQSRRALASVCGSSADATLPSVWKVDVKTSLEKVEFPGCGPWPRSALCPTQTTGPELLGGPMGWSHRLPSVASVPFPALGFLKQDVGGREDLPGGAGRRGAQHSRAGEPHAVGTGLGSPAHVRG